eukprot:GFYU01026768.1.p1 GENE.GFYU01026768.1~~GFYU01026768.1.p1  ORF type:complete len:137 (-),score=43.97 GFYU01026768.1:62-424(-)
MRTYARDSFFNTLRDMNNKCGPFIEKVHRFYRHAYKTIGHLDYVPIHDSSAVVSLLAPELYSGQEYFVGVEAQYQSSYTQGMTVVDFTGALKKAANVKVLMEVDGDAVLNFILSQVSLLP